MIDSGDYPCLSFCTTCGHDFSGDRMFDRHRVGKHDYTYTEGLRMSPPREDGRRCLTPEEMRELGWRPYTDDELRASTRHRKRAGFGIELWFNPTHAAKTRAEFAARQPQDAHRARRSRRKRAT
jgi:hypothetical protein